MFLICLSTPHSFDSRNAPSIAYRWNLRGHFRFLYWELHSYSSWANLPSVEGSCTRSSLVASCVLQTSARSHTWLVVRQWSLCERWCLFNSAYLQLPGPRIIFTSRFPTSTLLRLPCQANYTSTEDTNTSYTSDIDSPGWEACELLQKARHSSAFLDQLPCYLFYHFVGEGIADSGIRSRILYGRIQNCERSCIRFHFDCRPCIELFHFS